MHHHQLIGINDLVKLTTQELRELDVRLRQILIYESALSGRDICVIVESLSNIGITLILRDVGIDQCPTN
ncbi:MAG: hypothetical protein K2X00_17555 [Nitrospiraceae bacterium]|nr:hypothetical protein [Nitrospiraceae bacterium]